MQIRTFGSLADLNEFLSGLGVEAIPEAVISEGLEALKEAGIDTNGIGPESFTVSMDKDPELPTVPQSQLDAYIEMTSHQIARLVFERDEARQVAEAEIESHMTCHAHMDAALKKARVQGYAEALYKTLNLGPHIGLAPDWQQEMLIKQAETEIEQMESILG